MKRRGLAICIWLSSVVLPTAAVRAQDEGPPDYDARTQGYEANLPTHLEGSSTLGAWFLFVPLAAITLGVMCKNAKRATQE